jgi:hypothetical protein
VWPFQVDSARRVFTGRLEKLSPSPSGLTAHFSVTQLIKGPAATNKELQVQIPSESRGHAFEENHRYLFYGHNIGDQLWVDLCEGSKLLSQAEPVEILARQHGIRQKRDDGGIGSTLTAYIRRAHEGTLSRLLVESSILLAASRGNPSTVLKEAETAYKVDTDAIAAKVKQEYAAKEKAKKTLQPTAKTAKKAA